MLLGSWPTPSGNINSPLTKSERDVIGWWENRIRFVVTCILGLSLGRMLFFTFLLLVSAFLLF